MLTKRLSRFSTLFAIALVVTPLTRAADSGPLYAQRLIEQTAAAETDLLRAELVVAKPHARQSTIFAAHAAARTSNQTAPMGAGKPDIELAQGGTQIRVRVPLEDSAGRAIGALGLVYPYRAGENQDVFLRRAEAARDDLAGQIASRKALFARVKPPAVKRHSRKDH